PGLRVHHARPAVDPGSREQRQKAYRYACGMGAVVKKNRLDGLTTGRYFFTYIRALLWNVFRLRWKNAGYHWERIKGLCAGWTAYPGSDRRT
ncbi:MAG TPA: hypothetical protein VFF68_08260, partial [Anaerolineaceae bacterium]|nr:hypothetical protein [Anaerolineaceae bacterium]